ncbi:hypothetical protein H9P43_010152 [Blastocladiella emersonii ATCC 22665]|nr:hypothetical protein H9P43_010152 [Blastocladiella emersonii ATCC 22665]
MWSRSDPIRQMLAIALAMGAFMVLAVGSALGLPIAAAMSAVSAAASAPTSPARHSAAAPVSVSFYSSANASALVSSNSSSTLGMCRIADRPSLGSYTSHPLGSYTPHASAWPWTWISDLAVVMPETRNENTLWLVVKARALYHEYAPSAAVALNATAPGEVDDAKSTGPVDHLPEVAADVTELAEQTKSETEIEIPVIDQAVTNDTTDVVVATAAAAEASSPAAVQPHEQLDQQQPDQQQPDQQLKPAVLTTSDLPRKLDSVSTLDAARVAQFMDMVAAIPHGACVGREFSLTGMAIAAVINPVQTEPEPEPVIVIQRVPSRAYIGGQSTVNGNADDISFLTVPPPPPMGAARDLAKLAMMRAPEATSAPGSPYEDGDRPVDIATSSNSDDSMAAPPTAQKKEQEQEHQQPPVLSLAADLVDFVDLTQIGHLLEPIHSVLCALIAHVAPARLSVPPTFLGIVGIMALAVGSVAKRAGCSLLPPVMRSAAAARLVAAGRTIAETRFCKRILAALFIIPGSVITILAAMVVCPAQLAYLAGKRVVASMFSRLIAGKYAATSLMHLVCSSARETRARVALTVVSASPRIHMAVDIIAPLVYLGCGTLAAEHLSPVDQLSVYVAILELISVYHVATEDRVQPAVSVPELELVPEMEEAKMQASEMQASMKKKQAYEKKKARKARNALKAREAREALKASAETKSSSILADAIQEQQPEATPDAVDIQQQQQQQQPEATPDAVNIQQQQQQQQPEATPDAVNIQQQQQQQPEATPAAVKIQQQVEQPEADVTDAADSQSETQVQAVLSKEKLQVADAAVPGKHRVPYTKCEMREYTRTIRQAYQLPKFPFAGRNASALVGAYKVVQKAGTHHLYPLVPPPPAVVPPPDTRLRMDHASKDLEFVARLMSEELTLFRDSIPNCDERAIYVPVPKPQQQQQQQPTTVGASSNPVAASKTPDWTTMMDDDDDDAESSELVQDAAPYAAAPESTPESTPDCEPVTLNEYPTLMTLDTGNPEPLIIASRRFLPWMTMSAFGMVNISRRNTDVANSIFARKANAYGDKIPTPWKSFDEFGVRKFPSSTLWDDALPEDRDDREDEEEEITIPEEDLEGPFCFKTSKRDRRNMRKFRESNPEYVYQW